MSAKRIPTVREDGTRESFIFYRSFEDTINKLSTEDQLKLYRAVVRYGLLHEEPQFEESSLCDIIWTSFKPQLDANWKRAVSGVKGAEYGSRGGNPAFVKGARNPYYPKGNPIDNPIDNPMSKQKITPQITPNININANVNDNNSETIVSSVSKKSRKKEFTLPDYVSAEFADIFTEWIEYKRERSESYKSDRSLLMCYNKLLKLSNEDPETAKQIIHEAMANNWKGFFELKQSSAQIHISTSPKDNVEEAFRIEIERTAAIIAASKRESSSLNDAAADAAAEILPH